MGQDGFDFGDFQKRVAERREAEIVEAREGLKVLKAQQDELETQKCEIETKLEMVEEKISELSVFLGEEEEREKQSTPQRDRGVLIVLRQIVATDWTDISFVEYQDFDAIVKAVHKIKPTAKESTIRSGLLRLVRDGTLEVEGTRGGRAWRYAREAPPGVNESSAPIPLSEPTDVVVAAVQERVLKAAAKAKDGIDAKTIAFIMDETNAHELHFEYAVKKLETEGKIEIAKSLKDDSTVIRLPVDPNSKEALKRTRVHGQALFPDMDKPSHA